MMDVLDFVVLALASWRLGSMAHYERGPFAVFEKLRHRLGVQHDLSGEPVSWPDTEMGKLLSCLDCGSVYIAVVLVGLYVASGPVVVYVALPFALSASAIIIQKWVKGG